MSFNDGSPLKKRRNLLLTSDVVAPSGDPLWANVWLLLPLDTALQGDVSNNAFPFARVVAGDYLAEDPLADVLPAAAKFGAAGWQAASNYTTGLGSVYESNIQAFPAGIRTWGSANWCAEGWVRIADLSQPAAPAQRRLKLNGNYFGAPPVQLLDIGTRLDRLIVDIRVGPLGSLSVPVNVIGTSSAISGGRRFTSTAGTFATNDFYFVVVSLLNGVLYLTANGVIVGQYTIATFVYGNTWDFVTVGGNESGNLGAPDSLASGPFPAACGPDALDDWRITMGADRYTSFPPPTPAAAFPIGP